MKHLLFNLVFVLLLSCSSSNEITFQNDSEIYKPKGLFSSSFGNETALDNIQVNGSLIRVTWSDIEPSEGIYDFSKIDQFLLAIKNRNLKWSLAIIAGGHSPSWLIDSFGVDYFEIKGLDKTVKRIPKIWDSKVNEKLNLLAKELANIYKNDEDLVLVYVPQMTANGIEGHFNGVSTLELTNAGLTATNWVNSVKETAKLFAKNFSNKAIAVEVHDIMGNSDIPNKIITDLWNDTSLNQQIGAAIWWISGKTNYQPNLINALTNYPGDIYAQAIGRSDQTERFQNNDYTSIFYQAQNIGVRYIELWEYEFANDTYPLAFKSYNEYANANFK